MALDDLLTANLRSGVLSVTLLAFLSAGCSNRRVQPRVEEDGPPRRGGTLDVVGLSDVDHLATTSWDLDSAFWLFRTFARTLLTSPTVPVRDDPTKMPPALDLALQLPTRKNGGISTDGLVDTFHLRRGVRWDSSPPTCFGQLTSIGSGCASGLMRIYGNCKSRPRRPT